MTTASPMPAAIEIRRISDNAIECDLLINDNLVCFPGHFPPQHVLPGVVIIDWAVNLGKQHLGVDPLAFASMEVIKFKHLITPVRTVTFHIKYSPENMKLYFTVNSPEGEFSSGKINLTGNQQEQ